MVQASWLLVAFPLLGALMLLAGGRRTDAWGHWLGCATVLASFVYGLIAFLQSDGKPQDTTLWTWMPVGRLHIDMGLRLDALSLTFVLLITGVGSLIHIYAVGYMSDDRDRRRFFGYFNLFVASMLILVLGSGYVSLYLGWEGVGLASYLLIGWYSDREYAAAAAKKAFVMNRVGDVGLAIAIFLMVKHVGSASYADVFHGVGAMSQGTVLAIGLLLLLGACGKSGQFPLQAWLPDAMAGPTPVSALIHAATMVTAGVYLVARSSPIFNASPNAQLAVTIVGAITLLLGAIIGCAYDDIKKVLAYSTVSQIGYMMLAVGLGPLGYALGIMHLLTHGFFKAGLFLGAGSVSHGLHGELDIRRMGGLWRRMPITFATFTCGYLALIGFPLTAGYFSKDAIIEAAFGGEGWRGWVFGGAALLGALLTAFYMTRLMLMVFFGQSRWKDLRTDDGHEYHPHESPPVMTAPMILLAVGSLGAGAFLSLGDRLSTWLEPSVGALRESEHGVLSGTVVSILVVVAMLVGVALAWLFVGRKPVPVERPAPANALVQAARSDLYGNALNDGLVVKPGIWLSRASVFLDNRGIDGAVNGFSAMLGGLSGRARRLQTGFVRSYALMTFAGSFVLVGLVLMVRFGS